MKKNLLPEEFIKEIIAAYPDKHPLEALKDIFTKTKLSSIKEFDEIVDNSNKEISMTITDYSLDLTECILKNDAQGVAENAFRLQDFLNAIISMNLTCYYPDTRYQDVDIITLICKRHNERFIEHMGISGNMLNQAKTETKKQLDNYIKKHILDLDREIDDKISQISTNFIVKGIEISQAIEKRKGNEQLFKALTKMQTAINKVLLSIMFTNNETGHEEFIDNLTGAIKEDLIEIYGEIKNNESIKRAMKNIFKK